MKKSGRPKRRTKNRSSSLVTEYIPYPVSIEPSLRPSRLSTRIPTFRLNQNPDFFQPPSRLVGILGLPISRLSLRASLRPRSRRGLRERAYAAGRRCSDVRRLSGEAIANGSTRGSPSDHSGTFLGRKRAALRRTDVRPSIVSPPRVGPFPIANAGRRRPTAASTAAARPSLRK